MVSDLENRVYCLDQSSLIFRACFLPSKEASGKLYRLKRTIQKCLKFVLPLLDLLSCDTSSESLWSSMSWQKDLAQNRLVLCDEYSQKLNL
jgi:hypothetical protein